MHAARSRPPFALLAALVLLAGFALRLALHDYHGLEGDDGFSLALARLPVEQLLPGLMRLELDVHPPLHFLALKGWTTVAGESLLSLRLMNSLADTLTGALLLRLAGRALNRRAALAAAVLWIVAPLLVYATYLARMYTLLAAFAALGAVCAVELIRGGRWLWALGLAVATVAALYTHVVGLVVALALGAALLVAVIAGRPFRRVVSGLVGLALAALLFLPFAVPLWQVYRSGRTLGAEINTAGFASPLDIPAGVVNALLLHRLNLPAAVPLLLLALASILLLARRGRRVAPLLALAWAGLLGMIALAALGFYKPRYLTPVIPPVLAVLAGAVVQLRPRWAAALLLALIAVSGLGLRADLDRATRDDWLAAAHFIAAHERPGDAIIVIPDWGQEAFRFHYRGDAPVTGVLPRVAPDVDLDAILAPLVEGHHTVWLVRYQPEVSDPDGRADDWFRQRAATLTEVFPAGMRVLYYDFAPRHADLPPEARPLDARFAGRLALRGVELPLTAGPATDSRLHPPSNWVHVVLYWEALQPSTRAIPRVRLTDGIGRVYGEALVRDNSLTARVPLAEWQPGDLWRVAYDVNLNPHTPPGRYNLEITVLDPETGDPLPAEGADGGATWAIAGQVDIE